MKGLLLIGGKATRLPGKCFLPMKDGRPVFCSAMDLFTLRGVHEVVIPVLPGHIPLFRAILTRFRPQHPELIFVEDDQTGVCNAITRAADKMNDDLFVLCGDNIYNLPIPEELMGGGALVRKVRPDLLRHLARWGGGEYSLGTGDHALITPWVLPRLWCRMAYTFKSVPDFLNRQKAPPWFSNDGEWWDIGTEQTYEEYWTS